MYSLLKCLHLSPPSSSPLQQTNNKITSFFLPLLFLPSSLLLNGNRKQLTNREREREREEAWLSDKRQRGKEGGDGRRTKWSNELEVFEDTATESPMGESPHGRIWDFQFLSTDILCVWWKTAVFLSLRVGVEKVFMWRRKAPVIKLSQWTCSYPLTGIRRVGCRAIEERGRASQVGHAGVVGVAVHGAGDWGVTGLLRCGAGHVTVRWHTTAAAHVACRKYGEEEEALIKVMQTVKTFLYIRFHYKYNII